MINMHTDTSDSSISQLYLSLLKKCKHYLDKNFQSDRRKPLYPFFDFSSTKIRDSSDSDISGLDNNAKLRSNWLLYTTVQT